MRAILVKSKSIAETDLYRPVHDYLVKQGYTVRSEVRHCDIAAVKGDDLIVIELKRAIGITLLAQAVERQKITDSVYVAVPRPPNMRRWAGQTKSVQALLRRLEIGLMLVSTKSSKPLVEVLFHPVPCERKKRRSVHRAVLTEINGRTGDFNEGGSCRRKLVTAYRENAIHIACCLCQRGPMSPKDLRILGTCDKTPSILYTNVYSWFERVGYGLYALSPKGREEIEAYAELLEHYRGMVGPVDPPLE